jgi:hypothetical protein
MIENDRYRMQKEVDDEQKRFTGNSRHLGINDDCLNASR